MLLPSPGPGQDVHPSLLELLGLGAEEQSEVALGDLEGMPSLQAVTWLGQGDVEADQRHAALGFHVLDRKTRKNEPTPTRRNETKQLRRRRSQQVTATANHAKSKLTSLASFLKRTVKQQQLCSIHKLTL